MVRKTDHTAPHYAVFSSSVTLRPNIFLSLCSPSMWQTRFHTHKKSTGKIIILYILIFIFLDIKMEDKKFCIKWQQALPEVNVLLISSRVEFWIVRVMSNYLICFTHSNNLLPFFLLRYCPSSWSRDMNIYLLSFLSITF